MHLTTPEIRPRPPTQKRMKHKTHFYVGSGGAGSAGANTGHYSGTVQVWDGGNGGRLVVSGRRKRRPRLTWSEEFWGGKGCDGEDSGLGHGAGLLLIDVAAHAAGVDAWGEQRAGSEVRRVGREARRGCRRALPGSHSDSSVEDNWWADSTP